MSSELPNGLSETKFPLEELSRTITKNASIVSQYLGANHIPQPSVDSDGPSIVVSSGSPQCIQQARQDLIAASLEILQLAIGPSEFLPNLATGFQYISCLSWLCQYDIFHLVPLSDGISYADLAAAARVPEQRLKTIIRMTMTNMLFREQPDGQSVRHSATSALLARSDDVHAYASYMCAKTAPMAMHMAAAHRRWGPASTRTDETAYNVAFDTDLPFFKHLAQDEARMDEFARYMRNVRSSEDVDLKHLVAGFTWQNIRDGGVVVDVGGSTGGAAIALAHAFPHFTLIVQDLPANAARGRNTLPAALAPRLTFQSHDFTLPQPVRGADVYLLRMILHDWPDPDAVNILNHIAAAMTTTRSRLLVMDTVMPMPGELPLGVERGVRVRDLTMLQAFNGMERDLEGWRMLLGGVVPVVRLRGVVRPFGSAMSVLEVELAEDRESV